MALTVFKNARIVDGTSPDLPDPVDFVVENGRFAEVQTASKVTGDDEVDLKGATVMPGLIDCHVHVSVVSQDARHSAELPSSLIAFQAAERMKRMLMRGFTTVRDAGGADGGLKRAVSEGWIDAPRLIISGKALAQTGGHTDFRPPYHFGSTAHYERNLGSMGRLCDGDAEVRRATREEIKGGADFIKVMADGGVASPADPIGYLVFSLDELKAIVEVAKGFGTYVAAHLYDDTAINRAIDCGIECVEHGNLAKDATISRMAREGIRVVPTNVTYDVISRLGAASGVTPAGLERCESVREAGLERTRKFYEAGVVAGYGSDLLGPLEASQSDEFALRARVIPPHAAIRAATVDAAKVLRREGELGEISPGALADFIVVDGNPLEDISVLTGQGERIPLIVQGGVAKKNSLAI